MPFQFIDNASIDRGARKKIRRHAAKGHNVGRVLTCRRKRSTLLAPARLQKSSDASLNVIRSGLSFPIGRSIGDNLSVCRLQADTTPASRNLILRGIIIFGVGFFHQYYSNGIKCSRLYRRQCFPKNISLHFRSGQWVQCGLNSSLGTKPVRP